MSVLIFILIWIVLFLFSLIGYLFFHELLWEYFGYSDTINTIAVIANFYICHFISWILFNNNPIVFLNKICVCLITGIIMLIGELILGYYILNDVFKFGEIGMLIGMFFVLFIGLYGSFFFLRLISEDLTFFINSFFDGLTRNTSDNFIQKAESAKLPTEAIKLLEDIKKDKEELERILQDVRKQTK